MKPKYFISFLLGIYLSINPSFSQDNTVYWYKIYDLISNQDSLIKTSLIDTAGWAFSYNKLSSYEDGYLEFKVSADSLDECSIGLSTSQDFEINRAIDYSFYLLNNRIFISELGRIVGDFGPYSDRTNFKIERRSDEIIYYLDNYIIFRNYLDPADTMYINAWILSSQTYFFDLSTNFLSPILLNYESTNETLISKGALSIDVKGGTPPYEIFWLGDTVINSEQVNSLYDTTYLENLFAIDSIMSKLYSYSSNSLKLENQSSGMYSVLIVDSANNLKVAELPIYCDLHFIDATGAISNDDELGTNLRQGSCYATLYNCYQSNKNHSLSFSLISNDKQSVVGFRKDTETQSRGVNDIAFGFDFKENGTYDVIENGSPVTSDNACNAADEFELLLEDNSVYYLQNKMIIYEGNSTSDIFYVDFILNSQEGSYFDNIKSIGKNPLNTIKYEITHVTDFANKNNGEITVEFDPFLHPTFIIDSINRLYFSLNGSDCSKPDNSSSLNSLYQNIAYSWTSESDPNYSSSNQNINHLTPGIYKLIISGINPFGASFSYKYYFEVGFHAELANASPTFGKYFFTGQNYSAEFSNNIARNLKNGNDYFELIYEPISYFNSLETGFSENSASIQSAYSSFISPLNETTSLSLNKSGNSTIITNHCKETIVRIERERCVGYSKYSTYLNGNLIDTIQTQNQVDEFIDIVLRGVGDTISNFHCSFPVYQITENYFELQDNPEAPFVNINDYHIRFKYSERYPYSKSNDNIKLKIYSLSNLGEIIFLTTIPYVKVTGSYSSEDPYKDLTLDPQLFSAGYYLLELEDKKQGKSYLKFKVNEN